MQVPDNRGSTTDWRPAGLSIRLICPAVGDRCAATAPAGWTWP